jgi:hypothetical protein
METEEEKTKIRKVEENICCKNDNSLIFKIIAFIFFVLILSTLSNIEKKITNLNSKIENKNTNNNESEEKKKTNEIVKENTYTIPKGTKLKDLEEILNQSGYEIFDITFEKKQYQNLKFDSTLKNASFEQILDYFESKYEKDKIIMMVISHNDSIRHYEIEKDPF